jgi:CBS domain containing-hemolysin-like protein
MEVTGRYHEPPALAPLSTFGVECGGGGATLFHEARDLNKALRGSLAVFGLEDPISTWLALAAVLLLVLANGFFVATEFSLVAVRRTRVQHLASEGNRRARAVLGRLDHLDAYIAATQLGITISSLALGWIGEPALAHLIEPVIERLPGISEGRRDALSHTLGFALAFSIITALHIVLGELAPKSLALQRPEQTSLFTAGPIHWFYLAFRPAIAVLNGVGNAVVRLLGIEPAAGHERVQSAEELMLAIDASREAGLVDQAAHDLVDRAFLFTDLAVRHVMTPRTEMRAIPVEASLQDVLDLASDSGFTRLPVYEQDTDHIVGILNVKRLMPILAKLSEQRGATASFSVRDQMREPLVVPEVTRASLVLARLRSAGAQMAVVVDEYGGTAGVVSLEDLVETLIGDVRDERDGADSADDAVPPDASVLDGLTTLIEVRELFGLDLAGEDFGVETIGGYVFAKLGRPAHVGDEVIAPAGVTLRVEALDGLRIAAVRVMADDVVTSTVTDLADQNLDRIRD